MKHKLAILSNINMDFVIRTLKKEYGEQIYQGEGYGNELGLLLDKGSSYHVFSPSIVFLIMDLMEVLGHDLSADNHKIDTWFSMLESTIEPEKIYYISDAYLWGLELETAGNIGIRRYFENIWNDKLADLQQRCSNVRIFPYRRIIERMGEQSAFSLKMWYMGKILHSTEAQKKICEQITHLEAVCARVPKKVLLLDLDNTLWGGLAGEADHTAITLSEDHSGLAYKNLQRVIAGMQKQGVLLGIVSKNNEADAMEIISSHPHMVLRPEYFVIRKINWIPKQENILAIAEELNLGLESFVFWDDNPAERELVKSMLPNVAVPDFPKKPEDLAPAMIDIYHTYFEKAYITDEDLAKTRQYAENVKRSSLKQSAGDFSSYLKQLDIVITLQDAEKHIDRLVQLVNKTNQFNVTTHRFEQSQMQQYLQDGKHQIFLYSVEDCFGDNGIVAAVIVETVSEVPVVDTFVMSCRVMGRNIEYAVMDHVENVLLEQGYQRLGAKYIPTAKNKPVEMLFEKLHYQVVSAAEDGSKQYEIILKDRPVREYYGRIVLKDSKEQ